MNTATAPAPRSYLFVPADRPARFGKALAAGADRVVLDLEDAVAPGDKALARDTLAAYLAGLDTPQRQRHVVRINDASTAWFEADLSALSALDGIELMLPKSEDPAVIASVRSRCPGIAVLALIESARGVLDARSLAAAPGVARLVFGTIDFALDLGLSGAPEGLAPAASQLALASRAAGLPPPVAGVTPEFNDDDALRADLAWCRAFGFAAKLCIHPRQVATLHAALCPTQTELDWARRVIAAADGQPGAFQLDGRMVDRPVLQRAQAVLSRATPP